MTTAEVDRWDALRLVATLATELPKLALYALPRALVTNLVTVALQDAPEWLQTDSDEDKVMTVALQLGMTAVVETLPPHVRLDVRHWRVVLAKSQAGVSPADRLALVSASVRRMCPTPSTNAGLVWAARNFLWECSPARPPPEYMAIARAFFPSDGLRQYVVAARNRRPQLAMVRFATMELRRRAFLAPRRCLWAFAVAGVCQGLIRPTAQAAGPL